MKTAKVYTSKVYSFTCPECEREMSEPQSGSLNWNDYDVTNEVKRNEVVTGIKNTIICSECGCAVKIPARCLK